MEASVRGFVELFSELLGVELVLGEQDVLCFCHEERNPSCSVNTEKGVWHCKTMDRGGGWAEAYAVVKGVQLESAKRRARELGVPVERGRVGRPAASRDGVVLGATYEGVLRSYQVKLVEDVGMREFVFGTLGWSVDVVERFGVGVNPVDRSVVYPVRNTRGELVNLRFYYPFAVKPKPKHTGVTNHNSAYLWPVAVLQDDAVRTVVVCEGEKDVVSISRHLPVGWGAVTGTGGAGTWNSALNDLFEGKRVVVAFDCDDAGRKGGERVTRQLVEYAAEIRTVDLGGVDGFDVHDFFREHSWGDFEALVVAAGSVNPMHAVAVRDTNGWLVDCLDDKGKPHVVFVAEKLAGETPIRWRGGVMYRYDWGAGVYRPDGEDYIGNRLLKVLGSAWRKSFAAEVETWVRKTKTGEAELEWPSAGSQFKVNCLNGIVDVWTGRLEPHSPDFVSPVQVPVEYRPELACPAVETFLGNALQPGDDAVFYEIAGYLLIPHVDLHRMFMLLGSGANGKSTALKLLMALIGEENCSAVSPHEFEDDKFASAQLFGKLANVCADIESRDLTATATLKKIVTGDVLNAQHKNKDAFKLKPFTRLLFSANVPPIARDATEAFYRRFLVIPFENRFERPDRHIDSKLQRDSELSGLLNRALAAVRPLLERGEFTVTPSTAQALVDFKTETSTVASFLAERVARVEGGKESKADLFQWFREWAELNAQGKGMSMRGFNAHLKQMGWQTLKSNSKVYWVGMKYSSGDDIPF